MAALAEFFSPYPQPWRDLSHAYAPPQLPRWSWRTGFHVYPMRRLVDPVTFKKSYLEDRTRVYELGFLSEGRTVPLVGIAAHGRGIFSDCATPAAREPDGTPTDVLFLGADKYGQDIFSRPGVRARGISLSVGLVAIVITFVLGIGGSAGCRATPAAETTTSSNASSRSSTPFRTSRLVAGHRAPCCRRTGRR